jgi:hypothetical protein
VTPAAWRDVGNTPAAESRQEPRDRVRLGADLRGGIGRAAAADRAGGVPKVCCACELPRCAKVSP